MKRLFLYLIPGIVVAAYAAVCLHSVQEIHYLKSFFPITFSVEEAFYAAAIELIKVVIAGLPLLVLIGGACLFMKRAEKVRRE